MAKNRYGERDELLAALIAQGVPRSQACKRCHLSASTVQRRMQEPAFVALVAELRTRMIDKAIGRLSRVAGKAVRTLERLLESETDGIRLQAASLVLAHAVKLREHAEFTQRIERLEESAHAYARNANGRN